MRPDLPDVNLLLAYLDQGHDSHAAATRWLKRCERDGTEVRIAHEVALACIRLAANPVASRIAVPPQRTYASLSSLITATGVQLLAPNLSSWDDFGRLLSGVQGHRLVHDAHLAALAIANDCRLVTFDRDLLRFDALRVELLTP